jgi:hypothetical protein
MADIKEVMRRQAGPMPVWAWTALAASFIAGVIIFRRRMAGSSATGSDSGNAASGGPVGEFTSGQATTTTDKDGNQITTQYNASGPLTGYPGYITNQAGPMPYSGGDVYVNYPATNAAPPPPAQQTSQQKITVLNPAFNMVGWDDKAKAAPWKMTVANSGETWNDITARIYGFADNFAKVTDPAAKARVQSVAAYIKDKNGQYTGLIPDGTGPTPGSVVVWR